MGKFSRNSSQQKIIAKERISDLFFEADKIFGKDQSLADRYVHLARKIAMKFKLRLLSSQKRKFCKHCYTYLRPGANARVRVKEGKIVYYCQKCKKFLRIPLKN